MNKSIAPLLLVILMLVPIVSCKVNNQPVLSAEAVAEEYFEAIRSKDFDKVISFCSPEFLTTSPRDTAQQNLRRWNSILGDFEQYELQDWLTREQVGSDRTGTVWVLRYKVKYSRSKTEEILTLFRPIGSDEIKIQGHNITQQ